jgi:hypothetical protein
MAYTVTVTRRRTVVHTTKLEFDTVTAYQAVEQAQNMVEDEASVDWVRDNDDVDIPDKHEYHVKQTE